MPAITFPVVSFKDLAKFDTALANAAQPHDNRGAPPYSNGTAGRLDPWEFDAMVQENPAMGQRFETAISEIGRHNQDCSKYKKKAERRTSAQVCLGIAVGFPAAVLIAAGTRLPASYATAFMGIVPGALVGFLTSVGLSKLWKAPEEPAHGKNLVDVHPVQYDP